LARLGLRRWHLGHDRSRSIVIDDDGTHTVLLS
jgi:hypothetical protein